MAWSINSVSMTHRIHRVSLQHIPSGENFQKRIALETHNFIRTSYVPRPRGSKRGGLKNTVELSRASIPVNRTFREVSSIGTKAFPGHRRRFSMIAKYEGEVWWAHISLLRCDPSLIHRGSIYSSAMRNIG